MVIALNHDPEGPPRSPDLTPCDFFLWKYLKSKVLETPPRDINDLCGRIITEVDIQQQRDMIRNVFQGMWARVDATVSNSGHVEEHN